MSLSIVIPCFNEQDHIIDTLNNIRSGLEKTIFREKYEIIIVDDGSKDESVKLVKKYIDQNTLNISLYTNIKNLGLGHSIYKGINLAKKEYVIWFPGDDNLDSDQITKILNSFEKNKIIISVPDSKESRTISCRIISKTFVLILNLITQLNVPYYNSFNIYETKIAKKYDEKFFSFGFLAMLLIYCIKYNNELKFVKFKIKERLKGKSNAINFKNLLEIISLLFYLLFSKKYK